MATTTVTGNPYLDGHLAPVREELTVTDLAITGTIPPHLDGRYVRNGPNPVVDRDAATYHWFTGSGMVHGVRLRDGKAEWYRNRWVRSADVAEALGEQPRPGPVHAGFDFSANTSVMQQAGRTFAIMEAGFNPYELTDELETVGPCDFDGTLPGGYTAHPKRDPETGELHAVSYFWGWGNKVQYSVIGTDARVRRTVDIEVTGSPMMHDFSLTESHVVLYDLPCTFDTGKIETGAPRLIDGLVRSTMDRVIGRWRIPDRLIKAMVGSSGGSEGQATLPYSWNPSYPARVGVMPRDGDGRDVRWFDVEPCYVYHPLNAYDDGDRIVLDVVRHPKMFDTDNLGPNEGPPTLDRWTVDLAGGKVLEERLDDRGHEFPRVDPRRTGRRHRYGYAAAALDGGAEPFGFDHLGLVKYDLETGSSQNRSFGPGGGVSEFVFVPNSPDAAEDDGVLMGFAYDAAADRSDLMLLDAQTLDTVAAVHLPARVPQGFHGEWMPTT